MPAKNPKPLKPLLEGKVRGIYDRKRCSEKRESVIPQFYLTKIIRDGSFLISFSDEAVNRYNPY